MISIYEKISSEEFVYIYKKLRRPPTRVELFAGMEDENYRNLMAGGYKFINPFRDYMWYLYMRNLLTPEQEKILNSPAGKLIGLIESTRMTRVYKMPVLMSFYDNGRILPAVNKEQVLKAWKEFFGANKNWLDLENVTNKTQYNNLTDDWHFRKIMDMPVRHLVKSGMGYFVEKQGYALALCDEVLPYLEDEFFVKHFMDAVEYRTMDYFWRK